MGMHGTLRLAFSISRFRFWIYTGGTYVVGYALGMESLLAFFRPEYYLYLLYFFFPANIFIYGINDYWDEETDRENPKKEGKEYRVVDTERKALLMILWAVVGISLSLVVIQDMTERAVFLIFLALSYFYSAPPLRFKMIPFLDFSSNMLYIMPGIFGYYLAGGTLPPVLFILGGFFHIAAMHLFSAIPDIGYDRAAGITTTAVFLQKRQSLLLCLAFWAVLSLLVIPLSGYHPLSLLVLFYPLIPLALLTRDALSIERVYWYLPYVNTAFGGLLFVMLTISKV
jgi:lycopene elongase/hydratase (dihydrobisanhydrobacterioruberin-forming)